MPGKEMILTKWNKQKPKKNKDCNKTNKPKRTNDQEMVEYGIKEDS